MDSNRQPPLQQRDVLRVFFKHKKEIFLVWISCVVIAVGYSLLVKPTYEVSSRVLLKVGRENVYVSPLSTEEGSNPVVDSKLEEQTNSEVEIIKGRALLEKVVNSIGAEKIYPQQNNLFVAPPSADKAYINTLRHLEKDLKIEAIKKANVIRISFQHTDPHITFNVMSSLVNAYLEQHLQVHQNTLSLDFFRAQDTELKNNLQRAEAASNAYQERYSIVSPQQQKQLLLQRKSELEAEFKRIINIELDSQSRIDYYKSQTGRHGPNQAYQSVAENIQRYEAEFKAALAREVLLQTQIADYERELQQLPKLENDFLDLQQQVETERQNLRIHQAKFQEALYHDALDKEKVSNVSVIDTPRHPLEPISPNLLLNLVLSVLLGGIGGVGLAVWREHFDDRISNERDVERYLPGLTVLGSIALHGKT